MEAKLVVIGGKANKTEVKLKLPVMIGRGRDADVTVSHATVSRHHCLIYELDGALVVRDNGSLNGTVVDGERIQEAVLKPGQSLTIGPLTFRADYEHSGSFPQLGAEPSSDPAGNGQVDAMPLAAKRPPMEHPRPSVAAAEPELPDISADDEKEDSRDAFNFLDEEEPSSKSSSSGPSFGFLKEDEASDASAENHPAQDDSAAIFRFADEPPTAPPTDEERPSRGKPAAGKKAPAEQAASPEKAPAGQDSAAALDDFLNSLGLEE